MDFPCALDCDPPPIPSPHMSPTHSVSHGQMKLSSPLLFTAAVASGVCPGCVCALLRRQVPRALRVQRVLEPPCVTSSVIALSSAAIGVPHAARVPLGVSPRLCWLAEARVPGLGARRACFKPTASASQHDAEVEPLRAWELTDAGDFANVSKRPAISKSQAMTSCNQVAHPPPALVVESVGRHLSAAQVANTGNGVTTVTNLSPPVRQTGTRRRSPRSPQNGGHYIQATTIAKPSRHLW
ncbi:hypothetical protein B0T14DRAFT_295346 [Immersiella caudata]|uniref:Uncharacterized protein n=1 Tax=Immersiella caudata TaxID=314043 RepID=A0AA39WET5_9PEZI|nr:hypothetical protein B0T14DRAFT_295346 [Immersiella caudata]